MRSSTQKSILTVTRSIPELLALLFFAAGVLLPRLSPGLWLGRGDVKAVASARAGRPPSITFTWAAEDGLSVSGKCAPLKDAYKVLQQAAMQG